jgi:uncharacterized membrane protein YidH (DUF202 family)
MDNQSADPRVGLAENRTDLAKFRTSLSLDRTTLAWIRTTLTMATFGFGTVAFFRSRMAESQMPDAARLHQGAIGFGLALVVLGLFATVLAGITHYFALRKLRRDEALALSRWPLSITVALLLAIIGAGSFWYALSH